MKKKIKKVWNVINALLICVLLFLAVALAGVRLFGLDVYVVLSGSMEPTYKTGGVIYVKEVEDTSVIRAGDPITFTTDGETLVTHRVIEVTEVDGQTAYRTKGDANDVEDGSLVPASHVKGMPVFTIPYIGYLVTFIQSESGRYATLAIGAFLLLMVFLPDLIFGNDEEEDKEKKEKEKDEEEA